MLKGIIKQTRWMLLSIGLITLLTASGAQGGRGGAVQPLPAPQPSLMEQAKANGSVPVIVAIAAEYAPEAGLTALQVEQQRAGIAAARAAVLTELAAYAPEVRPVSLNWTIPFMALRVTADGLAALQSTRSVAGIYPDTLHTPTLNTALPAQDVPQAHLDGHTGAGAVVAVLDSGVQKNHEFLSGQVVAEACFSTNYAPQTATSICPNGAEVQFGSGSANPSKCADAPGCNHGTHVAGIVAGKSIDPASIPGTTIYSGIAPGAKVYAIQVFSEFSSFSFCNPNSKCVLSYTSDMISALQQVYADRAAYNIASVNLSLGGGRYFDYCDVSDAPTKAAIDVLLDAGVATVIAAGNNGFTDSVGSPACISSAITVGSVTDGGSVSGFSNSNHILDLWGVGSGVVSSVFGNQYESFNGTSMATPMVAGAWAVIKSIKPHLSVAEVLAIFNATGFAITDVNAVTRDLIQLENAADSAAGLPPAANLLADAGFEGALTPRISAWTKTGEGVKILCDGLKSNSGLCYVRAGIGTGKVSQTLTPVAYLEGDILTLSAHVRASTVNSGTIMAKITLVNGNVQKLKLRVSGSFGYTYRTVSDALNKNATKVKIQFGGTTSGKYYVDDVALTLNFE